MPKLKLAVVGCGAVTELSYLPAIAQSDNIELVALVDKSLSRARQLNAQYGDQAAVFDDYRQVFDKVEAAIVALPNSLHASVTVDLLTHGVHALVEKPMALNGRECEAMVAAAANSGRVLAVGMARRFCETSKFVKQALERELLGKIKSFDYREGRIFDWPVTSDAMFRKEIAGGGVLMDLGVHALDLLLWWFGDCEVLSYQDDSEAGLETNCEIRLRFQRDLTGIAELSRNRNLRDTCVIEGEQGVLTVQAGFGTRVNLRLFGEKSPFSGLVTPLDPKEQPVPKAFRDQVEDFATSILTRTAPFVSGQEGGRALRVIDACYTHRQPLPGWDIGEKTRRQLPTKHGTNLSGKRVLVTGGTGFIGGCLVERLVLDCKAQVRVLVRNFSHAATVARFPVEMVEGDITSAADVARATEGCQIIFHCAYGPSGTEEEQRRTNIEGTRNVLEAAAQHKIERLVHLSTLMVYGIPKPGPFDETAPRRGMSLTYADSKLDAEKLAFDYYEKRGVPVCVIQPTTVYGPFSTWHTTAILESLKSSRIILVDRGEGACNPVYVDDVVSALLLAATQEAAVGEAFLISGEQPTTWRQFYQEYQNMLGGSCSTVSMSAEEAIRYYKEQQHGRGLLKEAVGVIRADYEIRERILTSREIRFIRKMGRILLPLSLWEDAKRRFMGAKKGTDPMQPAAPADGKPMPAVDPAMVRFYAAKGTVRIDKAIKLLGYQPDFDLRTGMKRTEQWARWANLLEPSMKN
jgi:predicted dehydrogenase/nucleoside-diphosphate-sugar epimerase